MRIIKIYTTILFLSVCNCANAKNNDVGVSITEVERSIQKELEINTKVNMIRAADITGSALDYQSDGDPMTLEVVMLENGVDADHVSDDGEVIFIHKKTKDKALENLITTAYYLRTKKRVGEHSQSSNLSPENK